MALEHKLEMLGEHYKTVPVRLVHEAVSTVYGNDINEESIVITKLRLLICVLKHFGTRAIQGLAELMKRNFYSYDYVMRNPNHKRYDIIVGNPPYVEDFKSGLALEKKYGNIYANVIINAAKQLTTNGSMVSNTVVPFNASCGVVPNKR